MIYAVFYATSKFSHFTPSWHNDQNWLSQSLKTDMRLFYSLKLTALRKKLELKFLLAISLKKDSFLIVFKTFKMAFECD